MKLVFILVSVVVANVATGKVTRKRAFEDDYERQLLDFDPSSMEMGMGMGGHFNMEDTDDSCKLTSSD